MSLAIRKALDQNRFLIVAVLFIGLNLIGVFHAAAQSPAPTADPNLTSAVNTTVTTVQSVSTSIENFLIRLTQVPQSSLNRLLLVAVGVILLLAGWRVYEYIIIIAGAIVGASIASSLIVSNSMVIDLVVLLIGAIVGALLSMFLYYIAVFLIGAHLGIVLTNSLAVALSLHPVSSLVLLIGAIIGGLILLGLSFEFLIVVSALVGAQMLAMGLGLNAFWMLLFAVVGIIVQYGLTRAAHTGFRRHYTYRRRSWVNT